MDKKKELQEEYKELYGKGAVISWSEATLEEKISEKKNPKEDVEVKKVMVIDPNETYDFELIGKYQKHNTYQIQQESKCYDNQTDTIRKIRLAPFEDSPYEDEQREDTTVSSRPITFTRGNLSIKGTDAFKIRYLIAYDGIEGKEKVLPENMAGRNLFRLKDKQKIVDEAYQAEEDKLEAKEMVSKAKPVDLENFMRSRFGEEVVEGLNDKQIKVAAYQKADALATLFLKDFNNPKHKIKSLAQKAKQAGLISSVDGEVSNKQGATIYKYDEGRFSYDEAIARWVMEGSKEAKALQELMEDKLS